MNILDSKLELCSKNPLTGYYRDGYCKTDKNDFGKHTICAEMDKDFLEFTKSRGNNLYSVVKEGERWCLCEGRWYESYLHNKAPKIIKKSTNKKINQKIRKIIK